MSRGGVVEHDDFVHNPMNLSVEEKRSSSWRWAIILTAIALILFIVGLSFSWSPVVFVIPAVFMAAGGQTLVAAAFSYGRKIKEEATN